MKLDIINTAGEKTGKNITLEKDIFGIEPNDHAIWLDTRQYLANQRQGTHKTKERNEITGSTRKLRKQKGSGMARVGDIKNPLFKGGGRIFGPKPHDYGFKVNRKVKALARKSALSYKAKDKNIVVLDALNMDEPKTKGFLEVLNACGAQGKKTMIIMAQKDKNVYLSGRNVPRTCFAMAGELNTYDIMHADKLIMTTDAIEKVNEMFSKTESK